MAREQIRRLPVEEQGKLCGMVTLGDLANAPEYAMEAAEAFGHSAPASATADRPVKADTILHKNTHTVSPPFGHSTPKSNPPRRTTLQKKENSLFPLDKWSGAYYNVYCCEMDD